MIKVKVEYLYKKKTIDSITFDIEGEISDVMVVQNNDVRSILSGAEHVIGELPGFSLVGHKNQIRSVREMLASDNNLKYESIDLQMTLTPNGDNHDD